MPDRVNLVRPDGSVASVDPGAVDSLIRLGYRREESEEASSRSTREQNVEFYDKPYQKAAAVTEGVVGGLTLGAAELLLDDQTSREREEHLPGWKLGGEVFGTVVPAIISGGTSTGAAAARLTPTVMASRAGEALAGKVAKSQIGRAAVSAGTEGAISSGALTAAKVLTDQSPDSIESFTSEVGLGTLFGLGAGAALGGGTAGLGEMGKKAAARVEARIKAGQPDGAPSWKGAADKVKSDLGARLDDAEKEIARNLDVAKVQAESAGKRLQAEYDLGELPDIPTSKAERKKVFSFDDGRGSAPGEKTAPGKGPAAKAATQADEVSVPPPADRSGTVADDILEPTTALEAPPPGRGPKDRTAVERPPVRPERVLRGAATKVDEFAPTQLDAPPTALDALAGPKVAKTADTAVPAPVYDELGNVMSPAIQKLEKELAQYGQELTKQEFKMKRLGKIRGDLADPEQFAKMSPQRLVEVVEELRDISPTAASTIRQAYEKFLEEAGVSGSLGGIAPTDMARAFGVKPQVWSTLKEQDVPLLAAWGHMNAQKAAGAKIPVSKGAGRPANQKGPAGAGMRFAGKALRYLGGRAASKALGGGIGPYMLGWNAVDAMWHGRLGSMVSGAKQAAANRIDQGLAKFAVASKAARPVAKAVGPLVSQFSQKEYEESTREIHSMAGAGGREALYASTANLRQVDPELADKVIDHAHKAAKYLSSILPKPPPQGLFASTRWTPSPVDQAKTAGIVRVVDDPPYAVEAMSIGRLTPQMAQAFRETSPAMFQKVAESLLQFAQENPDAPPHAKRAVATMLGVPADSLQLYTAQLQAHFGENAPEPGPAQTGRPPPSMPTQAQSLTER